MSKDRGWFCYSFKEDGKNISIWIDEGDSQALVTVKCGCDVCNHTIAENYISARKAMKIIEGMRNKK